MADMQALLSRRKKATKKKGKLMNMNAALDQPDFVEVEKQVVHEFDEEGNIVGSDEVYVAKKKIGGLTAAVNAQKKKNHLSVDSELVTGEWLDEEEEAAKFQTKTLTQAKVADLDLDSQTVNASKTVEEVEREEMSRKMFHWTRKQALEVAEAATPSEEVEQPKVYRPRHIMEARSSEGVAALKELDNEKVFPTLGGSKTKKSLVPSNSAWGVVKEEVIQELTVKQPEGVYLGLDFIESVEFDGFKKGYSFKRGNKGVGYYWEGPLQEREKEEAREDGEEEEQVEEEGVESQAEEPSSETNEDAGLPEPSPAQKEADEEKERKRREKKAEKERQKAEWERQQALALEREEQEEKMKQQAEAAAPVVPAAPVTQGAPEPPPPEDRFAGLKKKKKKKKDADA